MTEQHTVMISAAPIQEVQQGWHELKLRVEQLEAAVAAEEKENKTLRSLLERVIDHRQKSHNELVLLLTGLVSRLPLNDIGVVVSKLVEHNARVSQYLAALTKGTPDLHMPEPEVLRTLDQTKRDLQAAIKPLVEELIALETPIEPALLQALLAQPDQFFTPQMTRANRCYIKGQVPRERVIREFGQEALEFFKDMTTDPKLNPRPKPDEIVLAFKPDFEALCQQQPNLVAQRRQDLLNLHQRVQRSKSPCDASRAQRIAFQKLSFVIELLYFYEHQNTEAPDVLFAQRLPALVEQLVLPTPQDRLEEKLIEQAEALMAHVIQPDHRQMIINNVGKAGGTGQTLKYVLGLRMEKVLGMDQLVTDFVRHLLPTPPQPAPKAEALAPVLRLLRPPVQRTVTKSIMLCERIRKEDATALGRALGEALGIPDLDKEIKARETLSPETERKLAWGKIKDLVAARTDAGVVAAAIRDRLHEKYDAEEIRQSWITLIEMDPISLIRIFCAVPYRSDGKTDSIARPVLETYVTRLTHEKYQATYKKIVNSLKNMYVAKPDSPTLQNFVSLVRWVDAAAADRISADIGMPAPHG